MRMTLVAGVLLLASAAHADERIDQAKREVAAADIDYKLGRFGDALTRYARAYELYPTPPLLFNIGQCHRNLKRHEEAVFFFEGYLRDNPKAANRALVEDLIAESKAELARAVTAPPPADVIVPPPAVIAPPIHVEPPPPPPPPEARSRVVPAALIAGGIGLVVAGGAYFYYGNLRGPDAMYVYDDTRLLGGTLVVLGGAAAITGTVLLLRHRSSAPVATATAHGAMVGWAGTF